MSVGNGGLLDGIRRIGARVRDINIEGGLPGAPLGYRLRGATASGPPAGGTWKTGDMVPDRTGTIWMCTAGGSPGSWVQLGDKPYQFRPETYGAKRDGKFLTDGAMAIGNVLTSATANFTAADQGKYVLVWGAITSTNSQPGYLFAKITQVNSSSSVTLSVSATIAVTGVGVFYGTDDTAALQAAVNAATTYSLNGSGALSQVLLSEGIYCSGVTAAFSAVTLNNTSINLPIVSATAGNKAQLQIVGMGSSQLPHWTQPNPPQSGSIIAAMNTGGSLPAGGNQAYGPSSIMAGAVNGYGGGGGTFSNMHLTLKSFTVLVPMSAGAYCGPDLYGLGQATVDDVSYLPMAVIPTSTTWPALNPGSGTIYGSPTYYPSYSYGLRMPSDGNNAISDVGSFTSYFTQISLIGSEHCTFVSLKSLFSQYGIIAMTNTGGSSHGIAGMYWTCEAVRYPVGSVSSGFFSLGATISITILRVDLESQTQIVNDAASKLYGEIGFNVIGTAGSYLATQYAAGGTGVKLRRADFGPGPVTLPGTGTGSPPASGATWNNYYYRDLWITLSATGITGVNIDSAAQAVPSGATTYVFMLPAGRNFSPTYSGTLTMTAVAF